MNVYRSTDFLHVTISGAVRAGKRPPDGARRRPYFTGNPPKSVLVAVGVLVAPDLRQRQAREILHMEDLSTVWLLGATP